MYDFQRSQLWQATLNPSTDGTFEAEQQSRLSSVYNTFWTRAVRLAQSISADVPDLTLHDEAHLSALWHCASTLTGSTFPINPLEAFVFGGAVLLHDTGHAFRAYPGGIAELKQTVEFRDAVAAVLLRKRTTRPTEADLDNPPSEVTNEALFVALRRLHAKQAEVLTTCNFRGAYLIDDQELRQNLGQLIGQVAASHHWDRNSLEKLRKLLGPPGFMPESWTIQPIKIACLLRCADAIQIDQRRAPAFALAIQNPEGQSRMHWLAQQLAQPVVKPDAVAGPRALLFTSQNDFTEDNADAWWIAYDLIRNANEELQGCYQLMKDLGLPTFVVDRIAGAEGAMQLARHVRTMGWRPINAEVRVSSVERIVNLLGGTRLYGNDPSVPLRELIQNASDAVRARRKLGGDEFFEGRIHMSLLRRSENTSRLIVEDDGIGMSERVLTGSLLEFGKSFWGSEEAQDEFPGLVSARLGQSGRFGIGFFSTLMIAQRIEVTSRRWDAGQDQVRKLTFKEGIKSRPLVSSTISSPLGPFSTRVELQISSEIADRLLTISMGVRDEIKISLKQLVTHLCPTLDCDVFVRLHDGQVDLAHSRKWYELDALEWVRQINFGDVRELESYLSKEAPFVQVIKDREGEPAGRAAIAFGLFETGIDAVGRLAAVSRATHQFSRKYVGAIAYEPSGPRRDIDLLSNAAEVKDWASAQATLLNGADINNSEKYLAAINIADFGGDPTPVAKIWINREVKSLEEVYDVLATGEEIFVVLDQPEGPGESSIGTVMHWSSRYTRLGLDRNDLDFQTRVMEAWNGLSIPDRTYHRIPQNGDLLPSCFFSCLVRHVASKGVILEKGYVADALFAKYRGKDSSREGLTAGTPLHGPAIKLRLTR